MPTFVDTLASYVPTWAIRQGIAQPLEQPTSESVPAAVLFADISGFTPMTERLTAQGSAGVEELTQHLNGYFGKLIAILTAHGGDIIKFAGDALLAVWTGTEEDLARCTHRAAQCSLDILQQLRNYKAAEESLTLHIGIAAGNVLGLRVGGVQGRWEFLIAGEPIQQMAEAVSLAQAGEACLSPEAWNYIQESFSGTPLNGGNIRLESVNFVIPPKPLKIPSLPDSLTTWLRGFLPFGVLEKLDAGQTDWLAELRCVTVLFVQLLELGDIAHPSLEQLQQATVIMEKVIYQYDGTIRQIIIDDKGIVLIAAFGLPPISHENDELRGILAAVAIRDRLAKLEVLTAIGVTTGRVYCGSVGNEVRREYALVGSSVNLAARLMVAAQEGVLCDRATYKAAQHHLHFETCPPLSVKGRSDPIFVYRPQNQAPLACRLRTPLVGRTFEKKQLTQKLQDLQQGKGGVIFIEGQPGIGKTRLGELLSEKASAEGIQEFRGAGNALEKQTSYSAWRSIFSQYFGLNGANEPIFNDAGIRHQVLTQLETIAPECLPFAPLLNEVLGFNFPDNEITQALVGKVRADNTHKLLLNLLEIIAKETPTLIILENAHWFDSASWTLARLVGTQIPSLLLVIITRPSQERFPKDYSVLQKAATTLSLTLSPLSEAETLTLVCQCLGVSFLPPPVAKVITKKAQGNPFFSEELTFALQDAGLIALRNGECHLTTSEEEFNRFDVPNHIQGIITSRLDRLTPMQLLTLKVASVIGRSFIFRILNHVYPLEEDRLYLSNYLDTLVKLDLTPLETTEPDLSYIFKHLIIQEVAYNLLLFSQRRQLHGAIARWYERNYEEDLSPHYSILAHHWIHAIEPNEDSTQEVSKAIDYLEKAGEQALRSHSLQEGVRFFHQALSLKKTHSTNVSKLREARWHRQLGKAYLNLGKLTDSRQHLLQALILLGRPMPQTWQTLLPNLLGQLFWQTLHRFNLIRRARNSPDANTQLLETVRIYDLLTEIYYHANEVICVTYAALRTLNLAERIPPSCELARAYGNSCFAAGTIPLHSLAETYRRLAISTAYSVKQPLDALARVLVLTGAYSVGVGRWTRVKAAMQQAQEICQYYADWYQWGNCQAILAKTAYFQGQFQRGIEHWAKLYQIAEQNENILQQAWGLNGQGEGLLRQGHIAAALELFHQALELFAQNRDRVSETPTQGLLALAYLYQGKESQALSAIEIVQSQLSEIPSPNSYYLLEGYASVAEVYLHLPHLTPASVRQKSCQGLHRFARIFPIGKPRAWLWQGLYYWQMQYPTQADKAWRKSLAAAQKLQMPYEEGLAYYYLGQYFPHTGYLGQAQDIFSHLGTTEPFQQIS